MSVSFGSQGTLFSAPSPAPKRAQLLEDAKNVVVGDRDQQYSGPEDSFAAIAELWTSHLRRRGVGLSVTLTPEDVAIMMTLLKVARLMTGGPMQRDTWMDIAGYAACGHEVSERAAANG